MALTGSQRTMLQRYQGYRSRPPTFLGLLRQSWQVEATLETDFRLTDGFFSAETFCALRSRVRRCKASRAKRQ